MKLEDLGTSLLTQLGKQRKYTAYTRITIQKYFRPTTSYRLSDSDILLLCCPLTVFPNIFLKDIKIVFLELYFMEERKNKRRINGLTLKAFFNSVCTLAS
jgi:hypothetical protein